MLIWMTDLVFFAPLLYSEKQKGEMKDRKVLEILQAKDYKIQELEQVRNDITWAVKRMDVILVMEVFNDFTEPTEGFIILNGFNLLHAVQQKCK